MKHQSSLLLVGERCFFAQVWELVYVLVHDGPIYYYMGPPFGIEPNSNEAASWAVAYGMFHWGISAWCLYAMLR